MCSLSLKIKFNQLI